MFWKILPIFFAVCSFFAVNVPAQKVHFTPAELAGTYSISGSYESNNITLNADGTYSAISTSDVCEINSEDPNDCLNYPTASGVFSVIGNIVKFNVLKYRQYDPKGELKNQPSQNYELLIIKWSERFYLIHRDSLKEFANAINMKLEPRKGTFALRYDYFYLRREGIEKAVSGLPDLPDGWNDFLLKNPFKAVILKVENQNGSKIAVINKGSKDGLRIGMQVVTGFSPDGSEIISVKKSSATVKLKNNLKKGDKIRSYYDPDNWVLGIGFVN